MMLLFIHSKTKDESGLMCMCFSSLGLQLPFQDVEWGKSQHKMIPLTYKLTIINKINQKPMFKEVSKSNKKPKMKSSSSPNYRVKFWRRRREHYSLPPLKSFINSRYWMKEWLRLRMRDHCSPQYGNCHCFPPQPQHCLSFTHCHENQCLCLSSFWFYQFILNIL